MASVINRGKNRWELRVYIGQDESGANLQYKCNTYKK